MTHELLARLDERDVVHLLEIDEKLQKLNEPAFLVGAMAYAAQIPGWGNPADRQTPILLAKEHRVTNIQTSLGRGVTVTPSFEAADVEPIHGVLQVHDSAGSPARTDGKTAKYHGVEILLDQEPGLHIPPFVLGYAAFTDVRSSLGALPPQIVDRMMEEFLTTTIAIGPDGEILKPDKGDWSGGGGQDLGAPGSTGEPSSTRGRLTGGPTPQHGSGGLDL